MSVGPLGTLLFPSMRTFSYLSPFEEQIFSWVGQEHLRCLQSPSARPWSNTRGDFAPWDAHPCVFEPFCS